jgi:hypothetical protein
LPGLRRAGPARPAWLAAPVLQPPLPDGRLEGAAMITPTCLSCRHARQREQSPDGARVKCINGLERERQVNDRRGDWRPETGWCPLHSLRSSAPSAVKGAGP